MSTTADGLHPVRRVVENDYLDAVTRLEAEQVAHGNTRTKLNCAQVDANDLKKQNERLLARLTEVRTYAELTLDSISVERAGMAEDLLTLIDGTDQ